MTDDTRALVERLQQAADDLAKTLIDWQSIASMPTLAEQQQNTIDVLRDAAAALSRGGETPADPADATTVAGRINP